MQISIRKAKRIGIARTAITEEYGFASFGLVRFHHPDRSGWIA